jgi:hypothetical protein
MQSQILLAADISAEEVNLVIVRIVFFRRRALVCGGGSTLLSSNSSCALRHVYDAIEKTHESLQRREQLR